MKAIQLRISGTLPIAAAIFLSVCQSPGQDVNVGIATIYDQNLFDINTPTLDRVTRTDLVVSKEWDFDASAWELSYNGSLLLFRDLTTRNYHLHDVTLKSTFQFSNEEEDSGGDEADSSASDADSSSHTLKPSADAPPQSGIHSDSLDQFLYASVTGASQFNRQEFAEFDLFRTRAELMFRQPFGEAVSLRPAYKATYVSYTNLSGLTNLEHLLSLTVATSFAHDSWLGIRGSYGLKNYPTSTYTATVTVSGPGSGSGGHGKGGGNGGSTKSVTRTITLTTPSVHQLSATVLLDQRIAAATKLTVAWTHLGLPSSKARILPQEINNVLEQRGFSGSISSESEIYDDHYGYTGNVVTIGLQQSFPSAISLSLSGQMTGKSYMQTALDFDSSATTTGSRSDRRFEWEIDLSKSFSFGNNKVLKPQITFVCIRNASNAPYYDFDKYSIQVGMEYDF